MLCSMLVMAGCRRASGLELCSQPPRGCDGSLISPAAPAAPLGRLSHAHHSSSGFAREAVSGDGGRGGVCGGRGGAWGDGGGGGVGCRAISKKQGKPNGSVTPSQDKD